MPMNGRKDEVMEYAVIIEPDGDAFSVRFPDLPGCFSCGDTYDEAVENAKVALEEYLATLRDFGEPIPKPKSRAATISVKAS